MGCGAYTQLVCTRAAYRRRKRIEARSPANSPTRVGRPVDTSGIPLPGVLGPAAGAVALTALELLVAFLQAYVFAILTCIYLNDAIHPGH